VARGFLKALAALTALAVVVAPLEAHAIQVLGDPELVSREKDPKQPDAPVSPYPDVVVRVKADASGLRVGDFQLKASDVDPPVTMQAVKLVDFKQSTEKMSLIIITDGKVRFMGNPSPPPEVPGEPARPIPGAYEQLKAAVNALAGTRAKHTEVALWVMTEKLLEKVPLGDPAKVTGDMLGAQLDYANTATSGLKLALESAHKTLASKEGRRVVVVIGDGRDSSETASFDDVAGKFTTAQIEAYFILASPLEVAQPTRTRIDRFVGKTRGQVLRADPLDQLPQVAANLAGNLNNDFTVTFAGETDGVKLPFDGATHEVTIVANREEAIAEVNFPLIEAPKVDTSKKGMPLWVWFAIGGGVLLLLLILLLVLRRRGRGDDEEEDEEEVPMVAAPQPGMMAPQPSGPEVARKTMMLAGGGPDEYPAVGWIVPLAGPNKFQTFKLSSGQTTIGTTPDCNVVIADPYMGAKHAEIRMQGDTYFLFDLGSANGTYVNQQRVSTHELLDNDQFTLGQTEFKFKSIT
jgi:hypothetical protein